MEDYMSECERIAVMEVGHGGGGGGRGRPREAASTTTDASKRRRRIASPDQLRTSPSSNVDDQSRRSSNRCCYVSSPPDSVGRVPGYFCASSFADHASVSLCSSNEPREVVRNSLRSADLEAKGLETESSTYSDGEFSRETTAASELYPDSTMEPPAKPLAAKPLRKSPAIKMPSTAEIEDFFSAAEKYQQQRFADKYNYDIVKDVPMEGRYQWVRLER